MAEDTLDDGDARRRPARQPSGADLGWSVTGTLLSGMAVWGGVGWLLDRWLDTRGFFAAGVLLGVAVAIYVVFKKFGTLEPVPGERAGRTAGGRRSQPTQKGRQ
jgi:F0F1-type ATP synthase assembly protein I